MKIKFGEEMEQHLFIYIYIQLLLNNKGIYISDTAKQPLRIQHTPKKNSSLLISIYIHRTQNDRPIVSDG